MSSIESVRDGDEDAARELVTRLRPFVLRIVRSHLPPRMSEEDLCQMIFIRMFRRLHQFSGLAPIEHWISRLAVNVCLNQLERERARPELRYADLREEQCQAVEDLGLIAMAPSEEHREDAREIVGALLSRLEPTDRVVITMLYLEELSIPEIRKRTGWSAVMIKVRAHRARVKLKRSYELLKRQIP